jgi:hypothetical protein
MADIEQQARELLAVVHESNGRLGLAALVRNGHIPASDPAITALTYALRAAPDGFCVVPHRVTPEMRAAFRRAYRDGGFWSDRLDAALDAMLSAQPTTLATVKPPRDRRTRLREDV